MDELFRGRDEVQRRGGTGSLATQAYPHVLLETVAEGKKAHRGADQTWLCKVSGDTDRAEQERLLASCENIVNEHGVV